MARQKEKLKLGECAAFDPARLKELPQVNETWEVDFEALPKPPTQYIPERPRSIQDDDEDEKE